MTYDLRVEKRGDTMIRAFCMYSRRHTLPMGENTRRYDKYTFLHPSAEITHKLMVKTQGDTIGTHFCMYETISRTI